VKLVEILSNLQTFMETEVGRGALNGEASEIIPSNRKPIVGLILAIVLVVLDKAGKLKGPLLYVLLGLAACMAIPLLFSIPWVGDSQSGPVLFARRALMICMLATALAGLSVWVTSSESPESTNGGDAKPHQPTPNHLSAPKDSVTPPRETSPNRPNNHPQDRTQDALVSCL
jgi:hypothetical protein